MPTDNISAPPGFFIFELVGLVIMLLALISMFRIARILGGELGKTFKLFSFAVVFIALSVVADEILEILALESLMGEIIFESLIYIGLFLIFLGARKGVRALIGR